MFDITQFALSIGMIPNGGILVALKRKSNLIHPFLIHTLRAKGDAGMRGVHLPTITTFASLVAAMASLYI